MNGLGNHEVMIMVQAQKNPEKKLPPKVEQAHRFMARARGLVESLHDPTAMVPFNAFCEGWKNDPRRYVTLSTLPELRGETPEIRAQELLNLLRVKKPEDVDSIILMLRVNATVEKAHVLIHEHCVDSAEELIAALNRLKENGGFLRQIDAAVKETDK